MKNTLIAATLAVAGATSVDAQEIGVYPAGSGPSMLASAENFTGHVVVSPLLPSTVDTPSASGLVSFAPSARTAWHTHPAGQMLIVTAGKGWVQREGEARQEIAAGDTVWIPAEVKHWHGATDVTAMSHIAITYVRDGKNADWMELVTDGQYADR
ncbi:cupin domain-containing protein [Aureimonas sp. Leaf324]|uniref:(R)-mandelonitrile lyase n=1 Tax=Aureimonas sp. Leaf324 TaxID=1736336 RepID=UPI0006FFC3BE|nr:cupin domain-containing protein [Aureimonas sp. Leaf324]KQQ85661.1 TetR family transcriptional regulator [Aureimonas sp. Leaf324]